MMNDGFRAGGITRAHGSYQQAQTAQLRSGGLAKSIFRYSKGLMSSNRMAHT